MQTKQYPMPLTMASQSDPMSVIFRDSGLITCSFSPNPAGLGEFSFDQSPCIRSNLFYNTKKSQFCILSLIFIPHCNKQKFYYPFRLKTQKSAITGLLVFSLASQSVETHATDSVQPLLTSSGTCYHLEGAV